MDAPFSRTAARKRWPPLALALTFGVVLALGASARGVPESRVATGEERVEVASGLVHRTLRRGSATEDWRFRVVAGRFGAAEQAEAGELLARLRGAGRDPGVRYEAERYSVSVGPFATRREAGDERAALAEAGFPGPLVVEPYGQDLTSPSGPWEIHVLEADLRRIRVEVGLAQDETLGLEPTRSLAMRRGALAAVNGGFFRMTGLTRGDSTGLSIVDGRTLSETDRGRAAVGFVEGDDRQIPVFGRPSYRGRIRGPRDTSLTLDGVNREREADEAVLFTPEFHRTTLTSPDGREIVVRGGRIREIRREEGSTVVPPDGFVVSIGPAVDGGPAWGVGDRIEPEIRLTDSLAADPSAWDRARFAASAGPLILWNGEPRRDWSQESISEVFGLARHPRTAIGVRADGTLLLVTVDGREPRRSVGMSLPELAELLRELGAVTAVNLDGGGSTTMVVGAETVNRPAGDGSERWTSDAVLLFAR